MSDYQSFVARKLSTVTPTGIRRDVPLPQSLFPHQASLTRWALKRGRSAIFADTGLGKSRMEVAWAEAVRLHTGMPVLMLAPLAVAAQTAQEAAQIGIEVAVCREASDVNDRGINITNYDRLHRFNPAMFGGVVLDESSIIKHHDAKTFGTLTAAFKDTPFKLPATATPAPNDWTELGTHAEFLGICTRAEMLAEFFTHDGGDTSVWRLKGHARQQFWRWVVSWGALIRRPSDLGYDDGPYNLPPLHLHEHQVEVDMPTNGMLFAMEAQTLSERRDARRMSMEDRVAMCEQAIRGKWADTLNEWERLTQHALETGVRREPTQEGGDRSDLSSEAQRAGNERPGSAQAVHGGLLRGESGEIRTENAGAAQSVQREAAGEVCGERGLPRGAQGDGSRVGRVEPEQEEGPAHQEVRTDAGAVRADVGGAGARVRRVRAHGKGAQAVSHDRPLPHDREGARNTLLALQHGHRLVERQPDASAQSDRLSLEPWLIWCDLNVEQDALKRAFGDLAFSVQGSDSVEEKETAIRGWLAGERPVMISKPSIMGWGLNFQHCRYMAFVGVTDSYEAYYQAVRRCWRFGQKRDVHVHIFSSKAEGAVVANLKRKEREAAQMAESLSAETRDAVMAEVTGLTRQTNSHDDCKTVAVPQFLRAA